MTRRSRLSALALSTLVLVGVAIGTALAGAFKDAEPFKFLPAQPN